MTADNLLQGFAVLVFLQWLSTVILNFLGLSFPAPLLGMLLLYLLLHFGIISENTMDGVCTILITKMGMLFLVPAVGIMLYLDVIRAELLPIAVMIFGGSVVILLGTALFTQLIAGKEEKH